MLLLSRNRLLPTLFLLIGCPAWGAGPIFNIQDYGARNDATAPATEAFRAAIQAAKAAGGGTVYVPAGNYVSGPIELVSNLVLYIEAGATVRFPAQRLPFTQGRNQGIECLTPVPLIGAENTENVTITGRGTLTTDNAEWLKLMGRPQPNTAAGIGSAFGPEWNHLLALLQVKTPQPEEEYRKVAPFLRPSFIRAADSRNILIQGIHIVGSPFWTIHLLYSENAVIRDVTLETSPGVFAGGIYVDSSRNIRISDSYLDTGDDGIVIKSGRDADGLRVNRPTENLSITNCVFHRAREGAVVIGSETAGSIRNVVASNIICRGSEIGVYIKSRRARGGTVEDVRFDNWTMEDVRKGISVTNFYVMQGETPTAEEPVSQRTPVFRNISISNMTINHAQVAIDIAGLPEMPISGLRIQDVIASGGSGLRAYGTVALELHNIQVNADSGPAFLVRDSRDLELDSVATRKPLADTPVIRLDRCPGAIVRGSRAFPGTGTFLSVAPGELKSTVLQGNTLTGARKASEEAAADFWRTPGAAPRSK
jgi:polygalacturonase